MTPGPTPCACAPRETADAPDVVLRALKALAHPVRLRMLALIQAHGGSLCVCEIERHFALSQPTVSHHLKLLREAGLVRSRQEGSWVHHALAPEAFGAVQRYLSALAAVDDPATARPE